MKKNSFETFLYSVGGVAIMLVVIIAFNALTSTVKQRVDLTQEKAYTLSAGSKAILRKARYAGENPLPTIQAVKADSGQTFMFKSYAQQSVADLLDEYKQGRQRQNHRRTIRSQAPIPTRRIPARLDGVEGQLLPTGEKFYFGLCVSHPRQQGSAAVSRS